MRATIDRTLAALGAVGAPATWVFENHDVTRLPTRYGGGELGRRRARAAALLLLRPAGNGVHLPGPGARARGGRPAGRGAPGPGLPPHERRAQGPRRLPGADPVDGGAAGFGFTDGEPWLPMPQDWGAVASRRRRTTRTRCSRSTVPRSRLRPRGDGVRLAREPARDDGLRARRPRLRRQRRRARARAARGRDPAGERAGHHDDPAPEHRSLGQERSWTMKTSLGIWAFGNMATRFNAGRLQARARRARRPPTGCAPRSPGSAT